MATGGLYGQSPTGALIAQPGTETTGLYGKSPNGSVIAQSGSETSGLYGNAAASGGTYFEWFVFQVAAEQPATPTGGSWSFNTNIGTPPSGWSNAPAESPTNPVWISIGLVNSRSTSEIVWSTPGVFSYSGQINGSGAPTSGIGLDGEFYIQTGVTPYAIWYKNSGTWVQATGSAIYVALSGDQTIAGVKTFNEVIQGSISGNAATATTATSATTAATATYATNAGSATTAGTATFATSAGSVPYSGLTGAVPTWNQDTTGNAATADYATDAGFATNANAAVVAGNVTGVVAIANGGTGASDATTARTNLGLGTAAVQNAGVALGVATLDAGGTVPLSQIPASIQGGVSYQGTWNATTNSPTLTSSVGTKGYYYVVSTAGSTNLNGITSWNIGDWAIFNGTTWEKIDNTDAVTSVNGYTGTVVLNANDVGALSDVTSTDGSVTITTPSTGVRDLSVAIAGSTTNVLCLVRNTTGATLTKGTVVYISGATGQNPTVSKALATSDETSAQTLGMMTADLANNSNGYVTVIGLIANIDTSAYTDGQQLYLSGTTAGTVTGTKPYAPIHLVYVAVVEHAHPTQGKLFVKVQNGYELDELHNVSAQTPTNGQTIVYNSSTQLWEKSFAPIISGTTIDNTVIGGTTPAAGTFTTLTATGQANLGGSSIAPSFRATVGDNAPNTMWVEAKGASSSDSAVYLGVGGTPSKPLIIANSANSISFRTTTIGGTANQQFNVSHTASAVNYVQVTGAATGGSPTISAQGSDSNQNITLQSKGTGNVVLMDGGSNTGVRLLRAVASGDTFVDVQRLVGGVSFTTASSVTNGALIFQSKGTGAIDLAAGSSGVNISNGGTVTAITQTAGGSYTSIPTVAITAPTTAGGVQATATVSVQATSGTTIASGGSGYTVGDVITVSGGTFVTQAQFSVATVSAGAITSLTQTVAGNYSVVPSSPASVTGGTGSGATLTMQWTVRSGTFVITNAGSGYVEQPTVSFSGGGGSGAAAYATVGSGTIIRGLGSQINFVTPQGSTALQVADAGVTTPAYLQFNGSQGNSQNYISGGSSANAGLQWISKGTGSHLFATNGSSGTAQFIVSHTASAVNYVQVTGGATSGQVSLTAQGSDTNVTFGISAKGANTVSFYTNNNGSRQAAVLHTAGTIANYTTLTGNVAGSAPVFGVAGSDTNIDLTLTPKGTGNVRFGTYTGTALSIAGYIEIKDAGGTIRKLAVVA